MHLSNLLGQPLAKDIEVKRIVDDTRVLKAGDIFVFDKRIRPEKAEFYIQQASKNGASAIISNLEAEDALFHAEPGKILAKWAKQQHGRQPDKTVAVTGTNGKTSVAWFYQQLVAATQRKSASVGTLGVIQNGKVMYETGYSSPTALQVHEILDDLTGDGVSHVCLEATSHALDLHRYDSIDFTAAALTNITQDHLDYHKTMDAYTAAKQRLFVDLLQPGSTAVLNIQKPEAWPLAAVCKEKEISVLTVGTGSAELVVTPVEMLPTGLRVDVKVTGARREVVLPLVGSFQAENLAVALGLVVASGIGLEEVLAHVSCITSVPGRMEIIEKYQENQPTVIVDFAHTPDALKIALQAVRPTVPEGGKLWVVFGAGGDRDNTKRPLMGQAAHELADVQIVTDDNPRTEEAAGIRDQVMAGCPNAHNIGDRAEAIAYALQNAGEKDIVLLAGKGHESGQIIGKEKQPFDDRDVARKLLSKEL
ncbi:MAG: UDP-N-acetylmuramoyl-L-alanyl-D-glutamate--2,6-diaminopimelate ligase [Alphaproteobacteria bacterium]|nr:UDP-N-acetylmuramoyl-L-alanyl-D-glutamate--2,6-diaminopimelate ligase [Alphaproteobacteria bacterium]MDD9919634.1 UDP-N-acetylmuramoyl-L-alanyl-D-glutamate--2,6-diaminopimelate ligase [Alphaproteobacteria bacterium]